MTIVIFLNVALGWVTAPTTNDDPLLDLCFCKILNIKKLNNGVIRKSDKNKKLKGEQEFCLTIQQRAIDCIRHLLQWHYF
jgi:hypothetical protein